MGWWESHDPVVNAIRRTDGIEWVYVSEEEAEALAACKQPLQPTTNGLDTCDELTVEQASRLAVTAVTADLEYWARTAASEDGRLGLNDLVRVLDVIRLAVLPNSDRSDWSTGSRHGGRCLRVAVVAEAIAPTTYGVQRSEQL
jgi:hypothetical protein